MKLASLSNGETDERFAIGEMDKPDDCGVRFEIAGVDDVNDSDDVGILTLQPSNNPSMLELASLELASLELVSRDGVKPDVGTNRECKKLTVVSSISLIDCVHVFIFELRNSGPNFVSLLLALALCNAVTQVFKLLHQCSFKRVVISEVICRLAFTNVTQMC